ncbi:hypothetical protein EC973_007094 [Apophysomyces ossiformis]|uniref:L-type lectin-like domain-containing protein n=1 Tax=Apophysomyces ossiformis TaxID=679940 RepID=A0A8H7EUG0_9FUNG|nr:hypothetical protein EC973_007094 [Apophysomyces ossiformis]
MRLYSLLTLASLLLAQSQTTEAAGKFWYSGKSSAQEPETVNSQVEAPISKFDYKLTFKKPYYYNGTVPYWTTGGDVIQAEDFVRLSPSVPNTKGWIWSDIPNPYKEWEVEIAFMVKGSYLHSGRGLAFWYTKDSKIEGPVFGSKDKWDGLSVWLDSANPQTHTPTTMVILNDGTKAMASGGVDPTKHMLGSCSINYRNTGFPAYLKVIYKDNTLSVLLDPTSGGMDYRLCTRNSGIDLPDKYFFGLSKIEEAEYQIRKLREAAQGDEVKGESAASLAVIFDTQRRALESLQMLQLQLEALGAPSPDALLRGDFERKTGQNGNKEQLSEISRVSDQIRQGSKSLAGQIDQKARQQEDRISELHETLKRLEAIVSSLDNRMSAQTSNMQKKINKMTKDSADAKGTLSTVLKYLFYVIIVQGMIALGVYIYWKLRVERFEKKFL